MRLALEEAQLAMNNDEVPVGCVIVGKSGQVVARDGNRTTAERNAARHCELVAIDELLNRGAFFNDFEEMKLFVTVEPCIMCATALRMIGLTQVVYGCPNERFGGCGSTYDAHTICPADIPPLSLEGGVLAEEAVALLKTFYERGNPKAPEAKRRRPLENGSIDR